VCDPLKIARGIYEGEGPAVPENQAFGTLRGVYCGSRSGHFFWFLAENGHNFAWPPVSVPNS